MAYAMAEVGVNVSAEALYEFLADFGSVSWMQGVTKVEVEGQGPGMARSIYAGGTECVLSRCSKALSPPSAGSAIRSLRTTRSRSQTITLTVRRSKWRPVKVCFAGRVSLLRLKVWMSLRLLPRSRRCMVFWRVG